MGEWFDLIQLGMNSVRARQALLGTNRALNQSYAFLEELPNDSFNDDDLRHIDQVYDRIPSWRRKLDILDMMLDDLSATDPVDERELAAFVHDFKTLMDEIDGEMTALAKVIQHNRH